MPGSRPDVKTCWNCADEIPAAADTCETCGAEQSRGAAQAPAGAAPQAKLDIGDLIAKRYEVRGLAAEGTLGGVYKVHDREIDVTLALKLVRPDLVTGEEARKALRASLKKARRFLHKNVIKLYESGEDGGRFFYTMEFVGGINLRKLLQVRAGTRQHFSAAESLPIIEQVASAVEAAHAQGLRHGNLKPENVLILPEGLKLTEFGLTDFVPPKKFLELHKKGNSVQYLAPEHAGSEPLGPRADIYSIGAILYEMLTGAVAGPSAPMASEINESLSDAVDDLLQRCLDADPKKRPASAAELHKTLQEIVEGVKPQPVTAPPVEAAPPAPKQEAPPPAPPVVEEAHPLDEGAPEPPARAEAGRTSGIRELGAEDGFPVHEAPKDVHFPGEQTLQESMRGKGAKTSAKEAPSPKRQGPQKVTAPPPAPDHPFADGGKSISSPLPPSSRPAPAPHIPTSPPSAEIVGPAKKGSPVGLIVGAVLLVAALVGGAFFMGIFGGKEEAPVAATPTASPSPSPSPSPVAASAPAPPSPPPVETASLPPTEEPPPPAAKPKEAPRPPSPEEEEARAAKEAAREQARLEAEERRREEQQRKEEAKAAKAQAAAAKAAAGRCPEGMVEIAGGAFPMGSAGNDSARDTWEKKLEPTDVKTFCIDQYEFPGKKGETPRAGVTWEQARALCSGRGKRLCTEAEWEKACKGAAGGRYPYGNQYDGGSCNTKGAGRQLSPSGSFAGCKSDYNVFDMSGNVKEWTSSDWSDVVQDKAVRGGSYSRPDWATRCAFRENIRPDQSDSQIGFRCCQ